MVLVRSRLWGEPGFMGLKGLLRKGVSGSHEPGAARAGGLRYLVISSSLGLANNSHILIDINIITFIYLPSLHTTAIYLVNP